MGHDNTWGTNTTIEQCSSTGTIGTSQLHSMGEATCRDLQEEIDELDKVVSTCAEQVYKYKCFNGLLQRENHEMRQTIRKLEGELARIEHKQKITMDNTASSPDSTGGKARSLFLRPCLDPIYG